MPSLPPIGLLSIGSAAALLFASALAIAAPPQKKATSTPSTVPAGAIRVEIRAEPGGGWTLLRDAKPYLIKGAGGDGSMQLLARSGGNSLRTWGADNLEPLLDEAHLLGLSVTVGIWLGQERQGFNYNNADEVAGQIERVKAAILRYKDHPAVLMWGIGNEVEGYKNGDNAAIWSAVNNLAAMAKKLDPNHPTMTVIAEVGGDRIKNINRLCPDLDIIGINSYAGITSIPQRYRKAGGTKPYVITEFGPPGIWEVGKNEFGVWLEPTSTQKADIYRRAWTDGIAAERKLCLGGYAFLWSSKQEATATWFGMFLPDGTKLAPVDAMCELWTGQAPANPCPKVEPIELLRDGKPIGSAKAESFKAGETIEARIRVTAVDATARLDAKWTLHPEPTEFGHGGDREATPQELSNAILDTNRDTSGFLSVHAKLPEEPGVYRLFAYVRTPDNGGATANIPILVK